MSKKKNTYETAAVQVYEREYSKGIRFYLHYSVNGKQVREPLKDLPLVQKKDRLNYCDVKAKAEAIAFERTKQIREGKLGFSTMNGKMLLKDWFTTCVERKRKEEQEGTDHHGWPEIVEYTGKVVEQYRKGVRLCEVDKNFVLGFQDYLKNDYFIGRRVQNAGKHLKPSSIEKKIQTFSNVLNMAVCEGLIPRNPFHQLSSSEKFRAPESEPKYLEEEEVIRLADTPFQDKRTCQVYLFMCFTGLRISDVKRIKWGDICFDGENFWLKIVQKKTRKRLDLPLNEQAQSFLPERGEATDEDLIFTKIPAEQTMNKNLKKWAKAAGIKKDLTLHTGRHTFGTLEITEGADLYGTGQLMGHSDIRTTQVYAKVVGKKKVEDSNRLNGILKKRRLI